MIQNFLLIDNSKGSRCKLSEKLQNLKDAQVALPIIADSALWQISSQNKDTNEKKNLAMQTEGHLVFFITANEAERLTKLQADNADSQIFLRATLEANDVGLFRVGTEIDLVFSTVLDLLPDAYYQMGLVLSEIEKAAQESSGGGFVKFNLLIHTRQCFSCNPSQL